MRKSIAAQNAACNAVTALVDAGSILSSGRLRILNADSTLLVSLPMANPAYQDSTDGTSVAYPISDATCVMDGTAALYTITNRDSTTIWDGSVTTVSGLGDVKLNSVILFQDSTVAITYASYIMPR